MPMLGRVLRAQMSETADATRDATARLVERAIKGDRGAFQELISQQYDFIFRVAFKWCGVREDAEDIAQDVVIKLSRILGSYDGRAAFTSWLYRVVINAVQDLHRGRARRKQRLEEMQNTAMGDMPAEQEHVALQNEMWVAVRRLPPQQRDAMLLIYAEEKNHAEAAKILNCREKTVSWHVHEAKKTLKKLL